MHTFILKYYNTLSGCTWDCEVNIKSHIDYFLYTLGAINGIRVVVGTETDTRISKYISKLTNHAIKETTKRSRLIYLHMDKLSPLQKECTPIQLEF